MRILFIEKVLRADKLGICYLSRILKDAGHSTEVIQDDIEPAVEHLKNYTYDFVLWSISSGEQDWMFELNEALKKQFNFTSVVGGPHFTYFPEQGEKDPYIDFVIQGPGELVILDLIEGRLTNKLIKGGIPIINELKPPDRSLIYKYDHLGKSPMKRFMAARFCPWNCSYCFNHVFRKMYKNDTNNGPQITAVDKIIAEVLEVKSTYGLELAYFNDDNLATNKAWLLEFCSKFKETGLKFCGSVRVENVTEELLKTMAEAGCVFLNMALEAGNPNTLELLRRTTATFEKVKTCAQAAMKYGIKIRLQNMVGLPVENPLQDALYTLQCNQDIQPTDSWVSIYQPYGKTDLAEYCVKKGLIGTNYTAQGQYSRSQFNIPDAEKLYILSKLWWYFIVYKVDLNFVKVLLEIPFNDDQLNKFQEIRLPLSKKLLYNF